MSGCLKLPCDYYRVQKGTTKESLNMYTSYRKVFILLSRERNMPFVESRQLFKGEQKMKSICVCYGARCKKGERERGRV